MSRIAVFNSIDQASTVRALVSGQPDFIDITTPSTEAEEMKIAHGLGRIPFGFVVVKRPYTGTAADYGDSGTAWTKEYIYVKFKETSVAMTIAVF